MNAFEHGQYVHLRALEGDWVRCQILTVERVVDADACGEYFYYVSRFCKTYPEKWLMKYARFEAIA